MPIEQRAEFVISLDGDDSKIRSIFNAFTKTVKDSAADLEKTTSNIVLFKGLKENLDKAKSAVADTTAGLAKLREQVKATEDAGGKVGKDLATNLRDAEKAAASANKEFAKQQTAVDRMAKSLVTAGVNLKALGTEEIRLATAAKQAAVAEEERQAAALLGIKLTREQTAELGKLSAAYLLLRRSGTATSADLNAASAALHAKQVELTKSNTSLAGSFQAGIAPVLGFVAAIGGGIAAFKSAVEANTHYETSLARVGSVTTLTEAQLRILGDGVRDLAQTIGFDLKKGLDATFDLLRAQIPAGNVLEVLAVSAEAAKVSFTDLGTVAKLSGVLFKAFGVDTKDIKVTLDQLFAASQRGGATLGELADGLGAIGPLAKATKTSVGEVVAIVRVLTQAGLSGQEALGAVEKMLLRISDPAVVKHLNTLGVSGKGLADVLQQLSDTKLGITELIGLEVVSKKAATGFAALTDGSGRLAQSLAIVGDGAGSVDKVVEALNKLRAESLEKLSVSLSNLQITLGQVVTPSNKTIDTLTQLVQVLNNLAAANERARAAEEASAATQSQAAKNFDLLKLAINAIMSPTDRLKLAFELTGRAAAQANADIKKAADDARAAALSIGDADQAIANANAAPAAAAIARLQELRGKLAIFVPELQAAAKLLAGLGSESITAINTQAAQQIAALDTLKLGETATAAAILAIQKKAAVDRLAVLKQSSADVLAAVNAEATARKLSASTSNVDQKALDAELLATKRATLGQIVAAYSTQVDQLLALERGYADKSKQLTNERVGIEADVNERIRLIHQGGLTSYQIYQDNVAEVDRLNSAARRALAEGDLEAAKGFATKALDLASGLGKAVVENGKTLVSQFSAEQTAIAGVKTAQSELLQVNERQQKAAKDGQEATKGSLEEAKKQLGLFKKDLEALNVVLDAGLQTTLNIDTSAVAAAKTEIDSLNNRDTFSTHHIRTVNDNQAPGPGDVGPPAPGFSAGGIVRSMRMSHPTPVRGFARGGPVFRTPTWFKVPGQGSGDTVPARLQAGSYVVRKSASRYYGDGVMGALARGQRVRGYAAGGAVTKDDVWRWAERLFGTRDPLGVGAGGAKPSAGGQFPSQGQFPSGTGSKGPAVAPQIDPKIGFRTGDSFQTDRPPISFDTRPVPEELITAINVLQYAREMLNAVGQTNPLLGVLSPQIIGGITKVENNPNDKAAITALLQAAETIGSNPFVFAMGNKTASVIEQLTPTWFVDWLTKRGLLDPSGKITSHGKSVDISGFAQSFFGSSEFAQKFFGGQGRAQKFFGSQGGPRPLATGGGVDSVPAMLTPGEWVIKRSAVERYGPGLLHAVNTMQVPRDLLAGMMAPPSPIRHFAEGGPVGDARQFSAGGPGNVERPINVNFTLDAGNLLSPENIRRAVLPVIRDAIRSGEIKVPTK